jgi:cyclophilin family peptidyl-prolyl cis-trans isomerase/HEAT repeat protein
VLAAHNAREALTQVAHSDSDWRVRVNAATALGNVVLPQGDRLPLESFPVTDNDQHVRLAALRAIGNTAERLRRENVSFVTDTVSAFLLERLNRTEGNGEAHRNWHEQMSAAYALAQLLGREAIAPLTPFCESPKARIRAEITRALGTTGAPEAFGCLQKLAEDQDLLVRIAALESLPKISAQKNALPIYLSALNSGDAVLVAIAAQNLAADSSERPNHAPAIIAGYGKLQPPVDVEAGEMIFKALADCGNQHAVPLLEAALSIPDKPFARAAAAALQKLTTRDYSDHLPKETKPHDTFTYAEVKKLKGAWATVETDAGAFELSFFTEEAPLVVLNFVRLAQRRFFDGLLIHRVVPNFVIQTGDPRGDMWGSPGYSIRSEFSRLRFGRGMVGMASVGADTEGSQWFITHSEQPHLDGRYSLFARVRKGMEVVDALQVGHRIQRVTIHF